MIQNDSDTLKERIISALEQTTLKDGNINIDDNGKVSKSDQTPALKHPDAVPNIKVTAGKPAHLFFQNSYDESEQVGIDALIDIIIKETLSYLQEKVELVPKSRYDSLEDAYNLLLAAMASAGTSLSAVVATASIGAALTAIATAGGGATRAVTTAALKATETTDIK